MSAADCIFCKIVAGTIPSPRIMENDEFICIRDIQPHAKSHFLVLPKFHLNSMADAFPESGPSLAAMIGRLFEFGMRVARENGLANKGFRSIINTGLEGGQTVFHLHLHLLGGELLSAKLN